MQRVRCVKALSAEDDDLGRVQKVIDDLGEYFDTVQIFCTRYQGEDDGSTVNLSKGTGNWFARRGQIGEWLVKQDEASRQIVRDDDGD